MARYHQALEALQQAAARTRAGVVCLPVPLAPAEGLGWADRFGLAAARHKALVLAQHLRLVRRALPHLRAGHPVLVREFSTIPLLMVAPALVRWRSRLLFVVNHNLQWALNQRPEAWAFRRLERLGFRFVFFETLAAPALHAWGFDINRHAVLRFPAIESTNTARSASQSNRRFIGFVGHFRAEKGMIEALDVLFRHPPVRDRLAVGVPNPQAFLRARGAGREFIQSLQLFNTASDADFRAFLAQCAVVVLNYSVRDYAWRPSGLLADCAAAGTPVVIPDLPVQREQLRWPTPIGEVFQDLDALPDTVSRALAKGSSGGYDFAAYRSARGIKATAMALDEIWKPSGNRSNADL